MADKRAFFKMDVGYLMNPKVAAVAAESPTAVLLHLAAIAYSAQHLTDGVVPLALVMRIAGASQDDAELLFKRSLLIDRHDGDAEVHDYLEHQRSAAEAKDAEAKAKRAARARWDAEQDAQSHASGIAEGNASSMPNPMPREKREREKKEGAPRARGTRLPDDFTVTDEMRSWAASKAPGVDVDAATEEFCDYWRAVAGSKGVKLDWIATWRNDMRRKSERLATRPGRAAQPTGRSPWDRAPQVGGEPR